MIIELWMSHWMPNTKYKGVNVYSAPLCVGCHPVLKVRGARRRLTHLCALCPESSGALRRVLPDGLYM